MQRLRKIRVSIIGLIISALLCIAGIFGVSWNGGNGSGFLTVATAEKSNTSEYLIISTASAKLVFDENHVLRFKVDLYETAFSSEDEVLVFSFADGMNTANCVFDYCHNTTTGEVFFSEEKERMEIPCKSIAYDTTGYAQLIVYMDVPVDTVVYLHAGIYAGETLQQESTFSASVLEIFEYFLNNGTFDTEEFAYYKAHAQELVAFYADKNVDLFAVNDYVQMLDGKLSFMVNIPTEYMESLSADVSYTKNKTNAIGSSYTKTWTDYQLVFTRSENLTAYNSTSTFLQTENVENYTFMVSSDVDNAGIQSLVFNVNNKAIIETLMASANDTEYYYYAQIVRREKEVKAAMWLEVLESTTYTVISKTAPISFSNAELATSVLESNVSLTDEQRASLQDIAGISVDTEEIEVELRYKTLKDENDPASTMDATSIYNVKSVYAQNKNLVLQTVNYLRGSNSIADFNVIYNGKYLDRDEEGVITIYETGGRTLLVAQEYTYSYDTVAQKGILTVVYDEFNYNDLSLRVKSNDPENASMVIDYYATDVYQDAAQTIITYTYSSIENQLKNRLDWVFTLSKDNVTVSGATENVNVAVGDTTLTITCPNENVGDLLNLSLLAVAEIIEDFDVLTTIEYMQIDWNARTFAFEETVLQEETTIKYTTLLLYDTYYNFETAYGELIKGAVSPEILNGLEYYVPCSVNRTSIQVLEDGTRTCSLLVGYDYNALFIVSSTISDDVYFLPTSETSLIFKGDYFVDAEDIPSGWRVQRIASDSDYVKVEQDAENPDYWKETTVTVQTEVNQKLLFPITVEYIDTWNVVINYFDNYKKTPFMTVEQANVKLLVDQYPDEDAVRKLTNADILSLLNSVNGLSRTNSLSIGAIKPNGEALSMPDDVDKETGKRDGVKFDKESGTYTVTLQYSSASIFCIDEDGYRQEIQVNVSCYQDWLDKMGNPEWTILALNTEENLYFNYANEIKKSDLYGFFSVAVFDEQKTDWNDIFSVFTSNGCATFYEKKEVKGSDVYKFFKESSEHIDIFTLGLFSYVGLLCCEVANNENVTQYSYFFYMDGTANTGLVANNNADSAFDTDSSVGNAVEDAGDWIEDVVDWIRNFIGNGKNGWFKRLLQVMLGVLVVGGGVILVVWLMKKAGLIGGGSAASNTPKKKTTARTTKKKTQTTKSKSGSKKK